MEEEDPSGLYMGSRMLMNVNVIAPGCSQSRAPPFGCIAHELFGVAPNPLLTSR
jgi:hypothetical protein